MTVGIYRVIDLLTAELKEVGFKTVTHGDLTEVDLSKQNIYPLAHLTITASTLKESTDEIGVQILSLDWVDEPKLQDDVTPKKDQSNEIDIAHDLNQKLATLQNRFRTGSFLEEILGSQIQSSFIYGDYENELAGYRSQLVIVTDNTWC